MFLLLILLNIISLITLKEPSKLKQLKKKYVSFLEYIPDKYHMLKNRSIISGFYGNGREIGYNTNKGYEIGICLDGEINEMFHVLLHELAHSTVKEYDHSDYFWNNFVELKSIALKHGFYKAIDKEVPFCGKNIRD